MPINFGICSEQTGSCSRSYTHFKELDWALTQWFSIVSMPGAGGGGRDQNLAANCSRAFHTSSEPKGFCRECGSPLIFQIESIPLGGCQKCGRDYNESDLRATFCHACGAPIEIGDAAKQAQARNSWISKLLEIIPRLQQHGYLPLSK